MDDLLVKYLLGETLPEEEGQVEKWISTSADHQQHFQQLKTIWESSRQASTHVAPDEADAWQRFRDKVNTTAFTRPVKKAPRFRQKKFSTLAAAVIGLIIGGGILYVLLQANKTTVHSKDKVITQALPDGTIVTLNKSTTLMYSSSFGKRTRTVELKGEAFFEVASQSARPFIVLANGVTVRVLGTTFNINTSAHATEVIVETGRVEVSGQNQAVQLTPHQKAIVSTKKSKIEKKQVSGELYNYYKTKTFICKETPLEELVAALNEIYPQHIRIADPQLGSLPLTATFHDQSLDTILKVIKQTFDQVHIVYQQNQIILTYKEP